MSITLCEKVALQFEVGFDRLKISFDLLEPETKIGMVQDETRETKEKLDNLKTLVQKIGLPGVNFDREISTMIKQLDKLLKTVK